MDETPSLSTLIAELEGNDFPQSEEAALILAQTDAGKVALVAATRHSERHVRLAAALRFAAATAQTSSRPSGIF